MQYCQATLTSVHCPVVLSPRSSVLTPRVIGGVTVENSTLNFVAALFSPSGFFKCTGTVISTRWILTARHCGVTSDWTVIVGTPNRYVGPSISIAETFTNPDFSEAADIAIIHLASSVPLSTFQFPALNANVSIPLRDSFARVVGYGRTHPDFKNNTLLRQVDLPITSEAQCLKAYSAGLISGRICAGYIQGGCDSCLGDSGGPLIQYKGAQPVLVGVVNSGQDCAAAGFPGLYARIQPWLPWLQSVGASFEVTPSVDSYIPNHHPRWSSPSPSPSPSQSPAPTVTPSLQSSILLNPTLTPLSTVLPTPSSTAVLSLSSPPDNTTPTPPASKSNEPILPAAVGNEQVSNAPESVSPEDTGTTRSLSTLAIIGIGALCTVVLLAIFGGIRVLFSTQRY